MGVGVLALLLSSPGAQSSEGSLQVDLAVSNPWESNQLFPMWGAFPFIVQGGAPVYSYLVLCLCTDGVQIVLVSRRGPLGRSGVGELDPGDLLERCVPLALSHLGSVGAARPPGRSLGGLLRFCPLEPGFLTWGAILRSSVTRRRA